MAIKAERETGSEINTECRKQSFRRPWMFFINYICIHIANVYFPHRKPTAPRIRAQATGQIGIIIIIIDNFIK